MYFCNLVFRYYQIQSYGHDLCIFHTSISHLIKSKAHQIYLVCGWIGLCQSLLSRLGELCLLVIAKDEPSRVTPLVLGPNHGPWSKDCCGCNYLPSIICFVLSCLFIPARKSSIQGAHDVTILFSLYPLRYCMSYPFSNPFSESTDMGVLE